MQPGQQRPGQHPGQQYAAATQQLECDSCGAALDLDPHRRTTVCLYCASPAVVQRPASPNRPNPTFVLAFVLTEDRARQIAQRWARGRWLAPSAFRNAPADEVRGVYVPAYLYTASAHSTYSASIGEHYTVTESYTTTDSQGRTVTRTRTRTETEWRQLSGRHAAYVADIVVTASRGIPNHELDAIEPFDLRALHRYSPKVVSGWITEEPSLTAAQCQQMAQKEALEEIGRRLGAFMPGDKHANLRYQTYLQEQDAVLTLLPIWVLAVRYHPEKEVVRLLVNGQTGRIYGRQPYSWIKITLLVVVLLAVVAAIVVVVVASQ